LAVKRSGGIHGMSMWQSAEIRVYSMGALLRRGHDNPFHPGSAMVSLSREV
jgi:hypothetical protein